LNEQDTSDVLNILVAADVLRFQELVDHLQKYLIENKSEWMIENLEITQRISSRSNNLLELQQFCTDLIVKSPEKLFKSFYFTSFSEKSLVQLITRDDLHMKGFEVWEHVLKWGLAQNPTFLPDPDNWSDDDFKAMKNTLQHCLPLIRFFGLSSKEFIQKVGPYKKLYDDQLYDDLLKSHMEPNSQSNENISFDSKIVNVNVVSIISKWVDKIDINDINNDNNRKSYLPHKFQLLLRGSRDGFTPKKFHELCDNKQNTVVFIKVKGTEEILGGYNPIIWSSRSWSWGKTKESFIFSFKNENNNLLKDAILSNVKKSRTCIILSSCMWPIVWL
jgi:hypothetical protein